MPNLVYYLLLFYVAAMPFENLAIIPGLTTFSRTIGVLAFAIGLLSVITTRSVVRFPLAILPLFLFVAWSSLSLAWTIDPELTEIRAITYWLLLIFVWLVWQFVDTLRKQQWLLRVFLASVSLALVNQYLNRFSGIDFAVTEERYGAKGFDLNAMAYFLITSMNIASYFLSQRAQTGRTFTKALLWAYLVAAALGVLFTGSRSASLSLVICITLMLLTMPRVGWKPAAMFFICSMIGGILIPTLVPSETFSRIAEGRAAHSFEVRVAFWERGLRAWSDMPTLGVGAGAFRTADLAEGGYGGVAHNTFVSTLVENGVIGFGLFVTFGVALIRRVLRMPSEERVLWIKILACYFPMLIVSSEEYSKLTWLLFALILRQSATLRNQRPPQWQSPYRVVPGPRPFGRRNPRPGLT